MEKLSKLFKVCNGMPVSDLVYPSERFPDSVPVYRPSNSILNIVDGFISRAEAEAEFPNFIHKKDSLIVSLDGEGSHTYSYLAKEDFIPNSNVAVLIPYQDLTPNEKLFYSMVITRYRPLFNYGRKPRGKNLDSIMLPEKHEIPSWVNSMSLDEFVYSDIQNTVSINNWAEFKISKLFDVVRASSEPIGNILVDGGKTPIVSSSERNNGISAYTNIEPVYNKKSISLAINGSVGACFYQEVPFVATADVAVLEPKFNIDKYNALFIATLLNAEGKAKWSYGRKWDIQSVKDTVIMLPAMDDQVDWDAIFSFMSKIGDKYNIVKTEPSKSPTVKI